MSDQTKAEELDKLTRECSEIFQRIGHANDRIVNIGAVGVADALLFGRAALRAKEILAHGEFGEWLDRLVGPAKTRTARRYIRLASRCGSDDISGASLSALYLRYGVISEMGEEAHGHAPAPIDADWFTVKFAALFEKLKSFAAEKFRAKNSTAEEFDFESKWRDATSITDELIERLRS